MNQKLTVLVNSCDSYSDLWNTFFDVLQLQWHDCPYEIILNTETKSYSYNGFNIKTLSLYKDLPKEEIKKISWSTRLIKTLESVKTPYVLFFLEDFYLEKKVDNKKVENLLLRVDNIKNFGALYLMDQFIHTPTYYDKKSKLFKMHKYVFYKVNASCAIWKTDVLKSLLREGESAWQFETEGTERAYRRKEKFYCQEPTVFDGLFKKKQDKCAPKKEEIDKVFYLDFEAQIGKGKWTTKAKTLLESLGLGEKIDFNKRGVYYFEEFENEENRQRYAKKYVKAHAENYFIYGLIFFVNHYFHKLLNKFKKK